MSTCLLDYYSNTGGISGQLSHNVVLNDYATQIEMDITTRNGHHYKKLHDSLTKGTFLGQDIR